MLDKVGDFYRKLANARAFKSPDINAVEYVHKGDDSLLFKYYHRPKADFKYRLPDFGIYRAYYQCFEIPMPEVYKLQDDPTSPDKLYYDYGNLVLYEPKTKKAKILNIYNTFSDKEPTARFSRYFYIDKNKVIQIYEAGEGEEQSFMKKTQEITILGNGSISIKNLR